MASLQGRLQSFAPARQDDINILLSEISDSLYEATDLDKFATFFYAVYDDRTHVLTYSNAGHHAPILLSRGSEGVRRLDRGGTVLGAFPESSYR